MGSMLALCEIRVKPRLLREADDVGRRVVPHNVQVVLGYPMSEPAPTLQRSSPQRSGVSQNRNRFQVAAEKLAASGHCCTSCASASRLALAPLYLLREQIQGRVVYIRLLICSRLIEIPRLLGMRTAYCPAHHQSHEGVARYQSIGSFGAAAHRLSSGC